MNEAVRIGSSKADSIMNSKAEFHQAPLVRVVPVVGATSLGTLVAHSHVSFLLLHFSTTTTKKLI